MMRQIRALIIENTFTSLPDLVPHALPFLGPFSFLCHQKWDSASKMPLIPATTPILMMSGARDEMVPKEHMRTLWEAVAKRGEKKTRGGKEYKVGLERAKFMEFEFGDHSQYFQFVPCRRLLADAHFGPPDDTCVQTGYWPAVADFVAKVARDDSGNA